MDSVATFVFGELQNSLNQGEGLTEQQARKLDGALLALGVLSRLLISKKSPYKQKVGEILCSFVLPFYSCPYGFIRGKACWLSGVYHNLAREQGFTTFFSQNIKMLANDELPVRMDAAVALKYYVEDCEDNMLGQESVEMLLLGLMKIAQEVPQEDVVFTLECLFEKVGDRLAPYAMNIGQQLVQTFWAYLSEDAEDAEDEDEGNYGGGLACYSIMRAMGTLLEAVKDQQHIIRQLEDVFYPVLDRMCSKEGQDVFEEVMELMAFFTYFSPEISERMWSFWPRLHQCLIEWAIDYFEDILVVLDNFITKGNERFIHSINPNYQESVFQICQYVLGDSKEAQYFDDKEVLNAAKLMECVLLNCKGKVDQWVGPYLQLALNKLKTANDRYLQDYLILVVANCFFYNAPLTLNLLHQLGAVSGIFQKWFEMLFAKGAKGGPVHFKRKHDKKICSLALAELLKIPDDQAPAELHSGWSQLMTGQIYLLSLLKQQYEQEAIDQFEEAEENQDDEDDAWLDDDEGGEEGDLEPTHDGIDLPAIAAQVTVRTRSHRLI
eukprot:TRINITY_DN4379_c1_g1_i7.p1 TRINITY_DN4379_c1_g1~~TRINITY_DN4379_c1_g1_i7.p1  ORF type:complete len:611 (-),score=99.68 TRINITY_DN4379_c1_g1_i7:928-2580(-)